MDKLSMNEEERKIYQACMGALVTVVMDHVVIKNVINKINNTNVDELIAKWQAYILYENQEDQKNMTDEQETMAGAVIATMHNLGMSQVDRDDLLNTLLYDTLQNPSYDPETLRSIYNEWRNRDFI